MPEIGHRASLVQADLAVCILDWLCTLHGGISPGLELSPGMGSVLHEVTRSDQTCALALLYGVVCEPNLDWPQRQHADPVLHGSACSMHLDQFPMSCAICAQDPAPHTICSMNWSQSRAHATRAQGHPRAHAACTTCAGPALCVCSDVQGWSVGHIWTQNQHTRLVWYRCHM